MGHDGEGAPLPYHHHGDHGMTEWANQHRMSDHQLLEAQHEQMPGQEQTHESMLEQQQIHQIEDSTTQEVYATMDKYDV